jgi:uncharacterized membrane protein
LRSIGAEVESIQTDLRGTEKQMLNMIKLEDNVIIYQSPEKVFAYTTDITNNPKWQSDILEIEKISEGPFGRGSTYRCVNMFMGQRFETEATVTEYIPSRKCSYKINAGYINGENSFVYEPVNGGTKFTTRATLQLGFLTLVGRIFKRKAKEQIKKDLNTLKSILENGG